MIGHGAVKHRIGAARSKSPSQPRPCRLVRVVLSAILRCLHCTCTLQCSIKKWIAMIQIRHWMPNDLNFTPTNVIPFCTEFWTRLGTRRAQPQMQGGILVKCFNKEKNHDHMQCGSHLKKILMLHCGTQDRTCLLFAQFWLLNFGDKRPKVWAVLLSFQSEWMSPRHWSETQWLDEKQRQFWG